MASGEIGRRDLRLDGIRGVAVLLVLLYHATTPVKVLGTDKRILPGGWVGVDVFFVLSGYLITSLLFAEFADQGRIDARRFYGRRIRRLAPALVVLLAVWLMASQAGLFPVRQLGSTYTDPRLAFVPVVMAFTLLYNWLLAFDQPTPTGMGHLWTLAVEEQFYVVWVGLFLLAARFRRPRRMLFALVTAGAFASAVFTAIEASGRRDFAYFSSPTSALGLFVGAAVALRPSVRGGTATVAAGFGLILACGLLVPDTGPDLLPVAVFAACVGTALLIVGRSRPLDRALRGGWLVWMGRRSYAIYLWSSPLAYALSVWGGQTWAMDVVLLGATLALAELSWRLVERRFLPSQAALSSGARPARSRIAATTSAPTASVASTPAASRTPGSSINASGTSVAPDAA